MTGRIRRFSLIAIVSALLLITHPINAQSSGKIGASNGEIVGAIVGISAGLAAIGIGTYYAIHHAHNLTGCAAETGNGLALTTEGGGQAYVLQGETGGIKAGERVSVSGKKGKQSSNALRSFQVERLSKDLGPCKSSTATR